MGAQSSVEVPNTDPKETRSRIQITDMDDTDISLDGKIPCSRSNSKESLGSARSKESMPTFIQSYESDESDESEESEESEDGLSRRSSAAATPASRSRSNSKEHPGTSRSMFEEQKHMMLMGASMMINTRVQSPTGLLQEKQATDPPYGTPERDLDALPEESATSTTSGGVGDVHSPARQIRLGQRTSDALPPLALDKRTLPLSASKSVELSTSTGRLSMTPPPCGTSARKSQTGSIGGMMNAYTAYSTWRPVLLTSRTLTSVVHHKDPKQVTGEVKGLSLCVASNQLSQVRELLNLGHDVNTVDADGDRAPLHWAAARGHRECIDLLLKAGADKTARDAEGRTPSELAVECDRSAIHDLLKYGAPREDSKKMTGTEGPVSMRCALGNPQELTSLLRAFEIEKRKRASELEKDPRLRQLFSVNKRDADGDRFPLHWAAARGSTACVNILIEAGANIGALDANGNTAAALAFQFNQRATHEVLLRAIADLPIKASLLA